MSLPLKFYRTLNYIQLFISGYVLVWLQHFFVESIQCNMIENHPTVTPYVLHYGRYLLPICSSTGAEWLIGYWDSIVLRVIFVAWIVISIYVFIRIQRIKRFVSASEPIEFINPNKGEGGKSAKKGEGKKIPLIGNITGMIPRIEIPRLIRIVVSVTAFWLLIVILFQGTILNYLNRYIQEDRFTGKVNDFVVRFSKDGNASIYMYVDQSPVLLRSDNNIRNFQNTQYLINGFFEGLESFDLEDPFISECVKGQTVEVFARRNNMYYTLDGNSRYYIRFVYGTPTCQKIYRSKCIGQGKLFSIGERMIFEDQDVSCVCTRDGFNCSIGQVNDDIQSDSESCNYFTSKYYSQETFDTRDGCGQCTCDSGVLSCNVQKCDFNDYDISQEFALPIYYLFVDEPEPTQTVSLFAGRGDSFEVVAYRSFGQLPKTELTLNNGKSRLIFSSNQKNIPVLTPEVQMITGNDEYPELLRVYSESLSKYIYVSKELPSEICQQKVEAGRSCVRGDLGGLTVECVADDQDYNACDSVMRTFSLD